MTAALADDGAGLGDDAAGDPSDIESPIESAIEPGIEPGIEPWEAFADVLLQHAAASALARRPPDPVAGLKIDDADLVRNLAALPSGLGAEGTDVVVDASFVGSPSSRFASLVHAARLDIEAAQVLAVVAAVELDPHRQRVVAYLNDDVNQRWLTPAAIGSLLGKASAVAAVAPGSRLRAAGLVEASGSGTWASLPVRLDHTVAWWLADAPAVDADLPTGAVWLGASGEGEHDVVSVAGADRMRRLQAVVSGLGAPDLLIVPAPGDERSWRAVVRTATLAGGAGVVLDLGDANELSAEARDWIDRTDHLPWAISSTHPLPVASMPRRGWRELTPVSRRAAADEIAAVLGEEALAHAPALTAEQLRDVAVSVPAVGGDVRLAVRRLSAGHIDHLATRIAPTRTWSDLVLPPDRMEMVREVLIRARHRRQVLDEWGFARSTAGGVVALFGGPPGTGKTLAAEIIAADLGLDLYALDLSSVVSKFIGETEKNLGQLFDAAEASPVVLFFDEADALLGKRSEVSDAHDRYANIEVAYLLQRIERHEGVVILATNLANNMDEAFRRRIHVAVEFPMPEPPERLRLWTKALPAEAPVADVDLAFLAERFTLSGGSIRNAALTAAFLAADAGTPISMAHTVVAVRRELQKTGRLLAAAEFGAWAEAAGIAPAR